jgi:5'-phosphate synthase pdxT subunit
MPKVGVIAIQGDFDKHLDSLRAIDAEGVEVRTPEDLAGADRIIIPGGESTTVGMLMERFGLGQAIREKAAQGAPVWGTCMGMILMAHEVEGRSQYTLDLLDITIRRNAFGAQVHSFEDQVAITGMDSTVTGVFIRAPIVTQLGKGVECLGEYDGKVVAVRSGNLIGTSFHPELTADRRMHEWFVSLPCC